MPRAVCPRCGRAACICRWIVPAASGVEVAILQTREEARNAKNSAGLLRLSLAGSALEVADSFDAAQLHALLHAPWPGSAGAIFPILLYPAIEHDPGLGVARAPPLDLAALAGRQPRLVVLDGTWRKSRKLLYNASGAAGLAAAGAGRRRGPLPDPQGACAGTAVDVRGGLRGARGARSRFRSRAAAGGVRRLRGAADGVSARCGTIECVGWESRAACRPAYPTISAPAVHLVGYAGRPAAVLSHPTGKPADTPDDYRPPSVRMKNPGISRLSFSCSAARSKPGLS
jgi:hypothetical protein